MIGDFKGEEPLHFLNQQLSSNQDNKLHELFGLVSTERITAEPTSDKSPFCKELEVNGTTQVLETVHD